MNFSSVKNFFVKQYADNPANMFLHTGALGWAFSSLAQVCMLANDKKIPKKEKKFLIPQEILDALVNIGSFYTVTWGMQTFARKLAASGKITTPAIRTFCENNGLKVGKWSTDIRNSIKEEMTSLKYEIGSKNKLNINLSDEDIVKLKTGLDILEKFDDKTYSKFESGVKVAGNLLGAILSCNIITPMLKNPLAAIHQRNSIAKDLQLQAPKGPVLPTQNRMSIDDYKKQANLNAVRSGSSLKI